MSEALLSVVVQRIPQTQGWLLDVTEDLMTGDVCRRPAPTAPPIGWHLSHISRWGNRMLASLPNRPCEPGGACPPCTNCGSGKGERRVGLRATVPQDARARSRHAS